MRHALVLTLGLALVFLLPSTAPAQPAPGDAGVFAVADGTQSWLYATVFIPFDAYAVAFAPPGGIKAYELGFDGIPATTFVLGATLIGNPPIIIDDPATTEFIIGIPECITGDAPLALVRLRLLATVAIPFDTVIALTGVSVSSFDGAPGYVDCEDVAHAFTPSPFNWCGSWNGASSWPLGGLLVNPGYSCPLADAPSSFGAVKARFD